MNNWINKQGFEINRATLKDFMTFSGEIFIYNGDRQWTKAKIGQTVFRSNSVAVSPATQIANSCHPGLQAQWFSELRRKWLHKTLGYMPTETHLIVQD